MEDFHSFGELLLNNSPDSLRIDTAKQVLSAITKNEHFELIELRSLDRDGHFSEILVVDVKHGGVPAKNRIGINYQERLALRFFCEVSKNPEVRPLRKGFPTTMHQNIVAPNEPKDLCLYLEPWTTIVRTWTPESFLNRILWWLESTALESIHLVDQPVESLFFDSSYELVLPYDFFSRIDDPDYRLALSPGPLRGMSTTLTGKMVLNCADDSTAPRLRCYAFKLDPVTHGRIEVLPRNLGELEDTLQQRGASVIERLFTLIRSEVEGQVIQENESEKVIVLVTLPIKRCHEQEPETYNQKAFLIPVSRERVGVAAGVLEKHENRFIVRCDIGKQETQSDQWREIQILPVEIIQPFTPELARQSSGLIEPGPNAVIAGVGSLGSALFNLWSRSGWGTWTIIDPDHIKPHNLARHTAIAPHIGHYKVDVIRCMDVLLWGAEKKPVKSVAANAFRFEDKEVWASLATAELIIDVTTTLDYPREHGNKDDLPRGISVFLTPNGRDSVLLAEDSKREFRLDEIEPQYYRQVLKKPWGERHLEVNQSSFRSGASCRDLSTVLSLEQVSVHAGILARQIRVISATSEACIRIWITDLDTGRTENDSVRVNRVLCEQLGEFRIIWDTGLQEKIRALRDSCLPSETGGVILGYYDLLMRKIYVVDLLPAPVDSHGNSSGFSRGVEGLTASVKVVQERTARVVNYIGEWHSHPRGASSVPSGYDLIQLGYLAKQLDHDGFPALMLIVGESEERFYLTGKR